MALDFSALTVTDTNAVPSRAAVAVNPLTEHLGASYNGKQAKALTVPVADAPEIVNLLRRASDEIGCGVSIGITDSKGGALRLFRKPTGRTRKDDNGNEVAITTPVIVNKATEKEVTSGNVTVTFLGKTRTVRTRQSDNAE